MNRSRPPSRRASIFTLVGGKRRADNRVPRRRIASDPLLRAEGYTDNEISRLLVETQTRELSQP